MIKSSSLKPCAHPKVGQTEVDSGSWSEHTHKIAPVDIYRIVVGLESGKTESVGSSKTAEFLN